MQAAATAIDGVFELIPEPHPDVRGFFTRTFDTEAAAAIGVDPAAFVQDSQSRSHLGVVRGLHVRSGAGEAKLVRCSFGRIFDVVVDLRPASSTYRTVRTFLLDDEAHHGVFIPAGCAHGWQALTEPADVCYRIDREHDPSEDVTIAWNDAELAVPWPLPVTEMSDRDRTAPPLRELRW